MRASSVRRVGFFCAAVVAALAVAASTGTARGAVANCGSRSIGPGSLLRGNNDGAQCLLRAYQAHCKAAEFRLSSFGVDTIAVDEFTVAVTGGSCGVAVTSSFEVVPQAPHVTGRGNCTTLERRGTDIVAAKCTGTGLASTISLTSAA